MLTPITIHSWFTPHIALEMAGAPWATNGHFALAGLTIKDPEKTLPRYACEFLSTCIDTALSRPPSPPSTTANGWALIGQLAVSPYFVSLVAGAYPGAQWHASDEHAVAEVGGQPVALAAPVRRTGDGPEPPACPQCEGSGAADECAKCYGDGEWEQECDLGHWHDVKCERCDGKGVEGECRECGGTGRWRGDTPVVG